MLLYLFTLLRKVGGMASCRRKTNVPLAAVAAARYEYLLPVLEDVTNQPARLFIAYKRTQRNFDIHIFSALTKAFLRATHLTVFRKKFGRETEGEQVVHVLVAYEIYVAALTAVTAVGPASRFSLKSLEGVHSVAAVTRFDKYSHLVGKFTNCHTFFLFLSISKIVY